MKRSNSGMVLISALLFVVILSFIVVSITESSLMEAKMTKSYQDKIQAFYDAEADILSNEQKLLSGQKSKFEVFDDGGVCGVTFYKIDEVKKVGASTSEIISYFAKFGDFSKCQNVPIYNEGRLALKIVS